MLLMDVNEVKSLLKAVSTAKNNDEYFVGDLGKEEDMLPIQSMGGDVSAFTALECCEGAFVRRSTGEWRYAVLVDKSSEWVYPDAYLDFLVDFEGHCKRITMHRWSKLIRLKQKKLDVAHEPEHTSQVPEKRKMQRRPSLQQEKSSFPRPVGKKNDPRRASSMILKPTAPPITGQSATQVNTPIMGTDGKSPRRASSEKEANTRPRRIGNRKDPRRAASMILPSETPSILESTPLRTSFLLQEKVGTCRASLDSMDADARRAWFAASRGASKGFGNSSRSYRKISWTEALDEDCSEGSAEVARESHQRAFLSALSSINCK